MSSGQEKGIKKALKHGASSPAWTVTINLTILYYLGAIYEGGMGSIIPD